ncbi:DUF2813 domain-containing protein [Vibrio sp.]|uniref:DUF2813 domain-containing protein n=1 Tax=Vibrio sp. TaxID=678 RepID=UPI003AA9C093
MGENTWGKSSLLDALSIALPTDGNLYEFDLKDFHVDYSISTLNLSISRLFFALKHKIGKR